MKKIAVVSSSVRKGRLSHRVALFLVEYIKKVMGAECSLIDLKEYEFPLFSERLEFMDTIADDVADVAQKFKDADGIVLVSPVYNGSFCASAKNFIDLFTRDWWRKPVCVVSVTYGLVPGIATVQQLQSILLKMGARVASPVYTVIKAGTDFDEHGKALNEAEAFKYAEAPIKELMWMVEKTME